MAKSTDTALREYGTEDGDASPIKFAVISKTATGDLVAAVTGKKIRVLGYQLTASAAFTANFESGTTDITGVMNIPANGALSYAGGREAPAFETAAGAKLALTLGGTGQVSGFLSYIEV